MTDENDDLDFTSTQRSARNLGSLFGVGDPSSLPSIASTAYVPPKQPKKDAAPRVMIATIIQAFSYGADQKWTPKGKMGVALLSTDNTVFQLILYLTKTQQITSLRLTANTVFTPQSNNYLSFQDDSAQNWSIIFDTKQALADFALQIVLAKAYLTSFKLDHIIQDVREGEGSAFVDHESIEILVNTYKLLDSGAIQSTDSGETKPMKYKIGKNQNGKAFDDVVRGMKKNGQRVTIIGTILHNIEVTRVKRDKERSGSVTVPTDESVPVETKRPIIDEHESSERSKLLQRIIKEGGQQMFIHANQSSAFVAPYPTQPIDDDSISVLEFQQNFNPNRNISTPVPPVQFVQPGYHHPMHPQALMPQQQQPQYHPQLQQQQQQQQLQFHPQQQQQPYPNYPNRPNSSMSYSQMSMYPHSQYPPNVPPTDMYYPQQDPTLQGDLRPILTRISDKVDALNEKIDTKNSTTYPNMETSILLANIQRIIRENETVKKDLFDRSAKVEELNLKISDLLDRNQRLIEQSHLTTEQRNVVVNNVSEQSAQKILDLEKQKVELTTELSISTSKVADLQLQLNQFTQNQNENQAKLTSLSQTCEQLKDDLQKSEHQRNEIQSKFDQLYEQYKNEKTNRKQYQNNLNSTEEELNELKLNYANLEKSVNERKTKFENERKRWQNELDEQKQTFENELEELRNKLRKQRANENLNNNQEISRIEQELEKEWKDKLEKQQLQYEKTLNLKLKEFEQLKSSFQENETQLQQTTEELNEAKQQIEEYEQRCEKLQERCQLMKEKILEMNDEQPQLINEQIKQAINIIFQRLRTRIQPEKQYTGEAFLSKALEIIKKATLKVLSKNEDDDEEEEEEEEEEDEEDDEKSENNDEPINGKNIDQQTLNEEVASVENSLRKSSDSETNNQKNGWDTVDDLQQETQSQQQDNQTVIEQSTENTVVSQDENQMITTEITETVVETTQTIPSTETVEQEHETDAFADTIEENVPQTTIVVETPNENAQGEGDNKKQDDDDDNKKQNDDDDDDDDDELFKSSRPSIQDSRSSNASTTSAASKLPFNRIIPRLPNPDDSDDELFK